MIKRFLFPLVALALAACTPTTIADRVVTGAAVAADVANVPPPVTYADKTILDEKGGIAVELAYQAWRTAVEIAVDTGFLKGAKAARVAEIDRRAYAATLAVQAAYRAGNAARYTAAVTEAKAAIEAGLAVLKGA